MSELRQDRTTGAWVIVAPERSGRPVERPARPADDDGESAADRSVCPFCPGNETALLSIIEETPQDAAPGWRVRVVPNRYPLLSDDGAPGSRTSDSHTIMDGRGRHEVIVESPRHDADFACLSDSEIGEIVAVYHRRYVAMERNRGIRSVVVFRNRGKLAGASLRHPHAQIVGLKLTPPRAAAVARWAHARFRETGRCVTCEEIAAERRTGIRVIEDAGSFVALVPFAATSPFEMWLVPTRHEASFGNSNTKELQDLARLLGRSLRRLDAALGAVPYNFVIESAGRRLAAAPDLHWRLRIVPNLATVAGFEIGTGLATNPSLPERDAETLRAASPDLG